MKRFTVWEYEHKKGVDVRIAPANSFNNPSIRHCSRQLCEIQATNQAMAIDRVKSLVREALKYADS